VNPDAYELGTVFVQCQGCDVWHQLVDNMGLIEEYDLTQMSLSEAGEVFRSTLRASKSVMESSGGVDSPDAASSAACEVTGNEVEGVRSSSLQDQGDGTVYNMGSDAAGL
jgi:DNL zinc finger